MHTGCIVRASSTLGQVICNSALVFTSRLCRAWRSARGKGLGVFSALFWARIQFWACTWPFFLQFPGIWKSVLKILILPRISLSNSFLSRLSSLSIAYLIVVSCSRLLKPIVVLLNTFVKTTPALGIAPVWWNKDRPLHQSFRKQPDRSQPTALWEQFFVSSGISNLH